MEKILAQLQKMLDEYKIKYYIPPITQNNEVDLIAPFSFKFAAVNAGLGWIGKNDVVITKKYGPRVRLSVILINEQFVYGNQILKSNCPENCKKCVRFLYGCLPVWNIIKSSRLSHGHYIALRKILGVIFVQTFTPLRGEGRKD